MPTQQQGVLGTLLVIVIGLGLVATIATSTSTASTALAPFAGAQSLVIIIPLIFVAIVLIKAYKGTQTGGGATLVYHEETSLWARFKIWAARIAEQSRVARLQARF